MYTYSMKTVICSLSILMLSGCAAVADHQPISPYETSIVPVDCLNKKTTVNWLQKQINMGKQDASMYEREINAIKYKIWEIRTLCQPG